VTGEPGPPATQHHPEGRERVVDARGLRCPLPVIRLAQVALDAPAGTVVEVWATDPAARADVPAWCRMRGHDYLGEVETDGAHAAYRVRLVGGAHDGGEPPS
jgi:cysteine desulfurase